MVFTTTGLSGVQNAIGQISTNRPSYIAIGSNTSAAVYTQRVLGGELLRRYRTSVDTTTANEMLIIADWNSVEMSGIALSEFGTFTESVSNTGSLWNREQFTAVTFDGTNDLQVQLTFAVS